MTVLVTGATGLVGARLLPRLSDAGVNCRALLRSGSKAPAGAEAVEADLLNPESLPKAVAGVSAIIHLAAVFRTADEDLIWKSNLEGTRNLIAAAEAHAPDARFILASTSNVYDADTVRPGCEDDAAEPRQAYPASKLAAEQALQESGLTWSIHRFGFVYGDRDGHLEELPRLVANFKMHPAQRMSLVHHRDIATAMTLALTGAMDGLIVNIADDAPTTLYELVGIAGGTMETSSDPLDQPWRLHVNASRARKLGFRPTVRSVHQAVEEDLL
ncbi:conserved hypothetical protein [Hyphomonas neptunium ATCC 15444]|uniref:NAD-dependent epimerase/dehydratase domain-containing protein n=2 Tax=Hyphomonas TaxID=85 RepID=Q0C053_HYPNA|nr:MULTISPECIES: NAD(P)-dependent oxidoreductase [Hyphomonas]ABI76782.1 conserved hypothetical protein [Hyphomonas neptunium ATCC 15444]KCZ90527.1 hypothetical protein HHI_13350 [Hyphomonas hirschiana VP5]